MRQMQSMDVFCSTLMLVDQNDIVFVFLYFFLLKVLMTDSSTFPVVHDSQFTIFT